MVHYYHKWNEHWHIAVEAYDEHQNGVPNANNPTITAELANGSIATPFSLFNFNSPNLAHCASAAAIRCNAYAIGAVTYINYTPDPLNNFSFRPEIYYDPQGQRTGTPRPTMSSRSAGNTGPSPQVEIRPEIGYYHSDGGSAFNNHQELRFDRCRVWSSGISSHWQRVFLLTTRGLLPRFFIARRSRRAHFLCTGSVSPNIDMISISSLGHRRAPQRDILRSPSLCSWRRTPPAPARRLPLAYRSSDAIRGSANTQRLLARRRRYLARDQHRDVGRALLGFYASDFGYTIDLVPEGDPACPAESDPRHTPAAAPPDRNRPGSDSKFLRVSGRVAALPTVGGSR